MAYDNPQFWDGAHLQSELHRVFEICNGCRLCFNLCPSFDVLFRRIDQLDPHREEAEGKHIEGGKIADEHEAGALLKNVKVSTESPVDWLADADRERVVELCYECKLCFPKCPYVPPHEFAVDFPKLMLRAKMQWAQEDGIALREKFLGATDLVGGLMTRVAPIANFAAHNPLNRLLMEKTIGIARERQLPDYADESFETWWSRRAPAAGGETKVALFATCFVNYNDPSIGKAAVDVLERAGCAVTCPEQVCCGMPKLDGGDLEGARRLARRNVETLLPAVREGRKIFEPRTLLHADPAHRISRAGADARSARDRGGGDGPERLPLAAGAGEEAAQAAAGRGRQGRVPRRLPQPRPELRLPRPRSAQVGGRRRDARRPVLRHGRHLGNEEGVLRREPEGRRDRRAQGRGGRARRGVERLPAGVPAASTEDGPPRLPSRSHPAGRVRGRAAAEPESMKPLTMSDSWPNAVYEGVRDQFRREVIEAKKLRRVHVGPSMSLLFENRLTVKFQVQEILRAEHISEPEQAAEELAGFNGMLPLAGELSATLMIELLGEDAAVKAELRRLTGIGDHVWLEIAGQRVQGRFDAGWDDGTRAAAVQFVRFPVPDAARFAKGPAAVVVDHPAYPHRTELSGEVRRSLAQDLS